MNNKRNPYPVERQTQTAAEKAVCTLSSLLTAEKRCHRNVGYKNSVAKFDMLALSKCYDLRCELVEGRYKTTLGQLFEIYYPKYRIVRSTKFKDRIPQASFVLNYYYPEVITKLLPENCACIKGRGVDMARGIFKDLLRSVSQDDYCLKADIKSFFASIDHEKLFGFMNERFIKDEWAMRFYRNVINSNEQKIGIDLGSEVDQLSATTFLHPVDEYFAGKKYIRYADDIVFFGTKTECIDALAALKDILGSAGLRLSDKKTFMQPISRPVAFLGFTYLRRSTGRITMKRIRSKVKAERRKLAKLKALPYERLKAHVDSVRSMMKKGNRSDYLEFIKLTNKYLKEAQNA